MLYRNVPPNGEDTTIVPVGIGHVGCAVTLADGALGKLGTGFTVTVVPVLVHDVTVSLAVTL
jgi:hypothetical protein